MKNVLVCTLSMLSIVCAAQTPSDTISLNFLYGSVPAPGFRKTEHRVFGGLKGGHVNIQTGGKVLDFTPKGYCRVIPDNERPQGGFTVNSSVHWDTATSKWVSIRIPVTAEQRKELDQIFEEYARKSPYDYAVFGMRCAAASYDVLSDIGITRKMSNQTNIITNFYPKLLRKRMLRWARQKHYLITYHKGRDSRIWESDEGIL